jgi:hypothetical protein
MQVEPRITFHGVRASDELTVDILERLARLKKYAPRLIGGRVAVELRGRRHQAGNRYRVIIRLDMPGETLVVRPHASLRPGARATAAETWHKQDEVDPGQRHAKVAVREAFVLARRQLQDYVRRQRGDVKTHAPERPARPRRRTLRGPGRSPR